MDLENLWIGDWLLIVSKNIKGTFEGVENNCAKVKVNDELFLIETNDLEETEAPKPKKIADENLAEKVLINDEVENIIYANANFKNTIDLHIEKLSPNFKFKFDELSFQVRECDTFLKKAINSKQSFVTIIHGKGKGVLKEKIENLLAKYKDYTSVITSVNNGGAMEVWLKNKK